MKKIVTTAIVSTLLMAFSGAYAADAANTTSSMLAPKTASHDLSKNNGEVKEDMVNKTHKNNVLTSEPVKQDSAKKTAEKHINTPKHAQNMKK